MNNQPVDDTAMYVMDVDRLHWLQLPAGADAPAARHGHSLCAAGGRLWMLGGMLADGLVSDDLYTYTPGTFLFCVMCFRIDHMGYRTKPVAADRCGRGSEARRTMWTRHHGITRPIHGCQWWTGGEPTCDNIARNRHRPTHAAEFAGEAFGYTGLSVRGQQ